jgi:hypothetical protein
MAKEGIYGENTKEYRRVETILCKYSPLTNTEELRLLGRKEWQAFKGKLNNLPSFSQ